MLSQSQLFEIQFLDIYTSCGLGINLEPYQFNMQSHMSRKFKLQRGNGINRGNHTI